MPSKLPLFSLLSCPFFSIYLHVCPGKVCAFEDLNVVLFLFPDLTRLIKDDRGVHLSWDLSDSIPVAGQKVTRINKQFSNDDRLSLPN